MSLRWKITLVTTVSVFLALVVSALLVRQMISTSEEQRLRTEAATSLQQAMHILGETGISVLGATVNDPNLPQPAREAARAGDIVTYRGAVAGEPVIFAAAPIELGSQPAVFSLSLSTADSQQVRTNIDAALFWAGIATLFVLSALGILIASRLVRRLAHGAHAARAIADGQRHIVVEESIGKPFVGKDEVDEFAAAVDVMAAELTAKIAAERRFTADLAHELRTPLTGLVAAASLLPDSRPTELVQDRVAKLRSLIEDLLEVSRLETRTESIDLVAAELDACVEGIIDRVRDQCPEHGASVVRELAAPGCAVWLEPRRLERILGNLIRNGLTHGGGTVVVRSSPGRLEIEDHGPGFPAFILETGPERFVSKGGGIGLGLTIACGQATAMGIGVTLSNASGALITLDFTDAKAPQPHPLPAHHVSTTEVSGG